MNARKIAKNVLKRFRVTKQAYTLSEIVSGLSEVVVNKKQTVRVLEEKNPLPFDWDFEVTTGNDVYEVSIRALTDRSESSLVREADLLISCSCPFWRWQGPEYHARENDYLFGPPRGSASLPEVRDPQNHHYVCKHVSKVLDLIESYEVGDLS